MINSTVLNRLNSLTGGFLKIKNVSLHLWNILTASPDFSFIIPKKNISVLINKNAVSVVYATKFFSKIKVKGFVNYPINEKTYPDPDELTSIVSLSIRDLGVSYNNITLNIPKEWVVFKKIKFPITAKENIYDVVSYEIDRITPFKQDEALYDFKIVKDDGKDLTLMVAAANSEKIMPYVDALKERGIDVSSVTTSASAIIDLCTFIDKSGNYIFMDINDKGFVGSFVLAGMPQDFFSGIFSSNDERSIIESILSVIKSFKEISYSEGKILKFYISGNSLTSTLREILRSRLGSPVTFLGKEDMGTFLDKNIHNVPIYGIASSVESLWQKAISFNILKKGHIEKVKKPIAFTLILLLTIFSLGAYYVAQPVKIEKDRLKEIDHQISIRKGEIKKVEDVKKNISDLEEEISTIVSFKSSRPLSILILKELTITLPKTDWISRFKVSDSGITIEGYAESATRLLQKLEASRYFKKVEFISPTFRDTRLNMERFSMKMEIEGIKEDTKTKALRKDEDEQ